MPPIGIGLALSPSFGGGLATVLASLDFATLAAATPGATASPVLGVSVARTGAVATVRSGLSTVDAGASGTGVAANTARMYYDGTVSGLLIEELRINRIQDSRNFKSGASWSGAASGSPTYTQYAQDNAVIGPDGLALSFATRAQIASGGWCHYWFETAAAAGNYVWTFWVKAGSGGGLYSSQNYTNNGSTIVPLPTSGAAPSVWTPVSASIVNTSGNIAQNAVVSIAQSGGLGAGARDCILDLLDVQGSGGKFPTSNIFTSGARGTRNADVASTSAALASGGKLKLAIDMRPLGASTEYLAATARYLFYADANNCAYLDTSSNVVVKSGGSSVTFTPIWPTWSRLDALQFYVECGAGIQTKVRMAINGTAYSLGDGAALSAFVQSGSLTLLSDGSANVFSGVLEHVEAYR